MTANTWQLTISMEISLSLHCIDHWCAKSLHRVHYISCISEILEVKRRLCPIARKTMAPKLRPRPRTMSAPSPSTSTSATASFQSYVSRFETDYNWNLIHKSDRSSVFKATAKVRTFKPIEELPDEVAVKSMSHNLVQWCSTMMVTIPEFDRDQADGEERDKREVELMKKFADKELVVKQLDSWATAKHNYIAMEWCASSLQIVLDQRQEVFPRTSSSRMDLIEYFICCRIFIDLLRCVDLFHSDHCPIVHRNLDTNHFLLYHNSDDIKAIFKLAGLSMACPQPDTSDNLLAKKQFTAPDIYSLSKIGERLFQIDLSK